MLKILENEVRKGKFFLAKTTADDWNKLGEEYKLTNDYIRARLCYEQALALDIMHCNANCSLATLYNHGHGTAQNLEKADYHYQISTSEGSEEARERLLEVGYLLKSQKLISDNSNFASADEWDSLGEDYYWGRNDKPKDYTKARICYEQAIALNPQLSNSLYSLGTLFHSGFGVAKNLSTARTYYKQAAEAGSYHAKVALLKIDNPNNVTADQWSNLGEDYYHGKNNKLEDYVRAHACYEEALKLNSKHLNAYYSLGWLYEHAEGVDKDLKKARDYYEKSASQHSDSQKQLSIVTNLILADEQNDLGEDYYHGRNNKPTDYVKARTYYEEVLKLNPEYQNASYSLGWLYEYAQGVDKNTAKAREYYEMAASPGHYSAQKQLLILDNPNFSPANWDTLGEDYFWGKNNKQKDYAKARICYEQAIALDPQVSNSLYSLGALFHCGFGVVKNSGAAKTYYKQAAEAGSYYAKVELLKIDNPNIVTADQWSNLGENYYYATNNKPKDYIRARACYEEALKLNPQHQGASYVLGWVYEYAQDVDKDITKAMEYYEKSASQGHYDSQKRFLILDNLSFISCDQWCNLGGDYFHGKNSKPKDYVKARVCYEQALKLNPEHTLSLFILGLIYQYALGVDKDLVKARSHYELAVSKGCYASQKKVLILDNPNFSSCDEWSTLGEDYYFGKNNKPKDYVRARACYEIAIELNAENQNASYSLGWLYEHAEGVSKDIAKAREYYEMASSQEHYNAKKQLLILDNQNFSAVNWDTLGEDYYWGGNNRQKDRIKAKICYEQAIAKDPKLRRSLKRLESNAILSLKEKGAINEKDSNNNTALHRSAEYKHLKNCARLLFLGAKKSIENAKSERPLATLNAKEKGRITLLQTQFEKLISDFGKKSPRIIINRFFSSPNRPHDEEKSVSQLDIFYNNQFIKPLLDLAKLAVLGLHDLSRRPKFTDPNYDSDNDCEESINLDCQCLTIRVDPQSSHVENIAHFGKNGQGGDSCYGVYLNSELDQNTLYLGGKRNSLEEMRGTFIHELTHFIAKEVFKNNCRPYASNDLINTQTFTKITDNLRAKKNNLDPILQAAFSGHYEQNDKVQNELIVRVGQMIVMYPTDWAHRLESQAPELWNYYKDVFLDAVIKHTTKLQDRALGGWPLEHMVNADASDVPFHLESTGP